MTTRTASVQRTTSETSIKLKLTLDGSGVSDISTGLGFLDHMLTALTKHARLDLTLTCKGDTHVDDHHSVEDCAIGLGQALDSALGDRSGIRRFASTHAPLDEALARAVVDLSGRPGSDVNLGLTRDMIGDVACENITHFFQSLASGSRSTIHVDVLKGANDHHKAEAAFKALALAVRDAVSIDPNPSGIPSTKGVL